MTALISLLVLAILAGGGWFAWLQFGGLAFGGQQQQRIGVTEVAAVDSKRKLVLIHRDGVEHLIMTGGPIDVVIEQGIQSPRKAAAAQPALAPSHYEPRFATPQANLAPEPAGLDPAQPGSFGRLRQRPASTQAAAEPQPRSETPGFASGSNR